MKASFLLLALAIGIGKAQASDAPKAKSAHSPVVRNILSSQLPTRLLTTIKKNYKDYWITDLHRESLNGKVSYYITLENPNQTVKLNTTRTAGWSIFRVVPKDSNNR